MTPEPTRSRIAVWEALSDLCLDTELQPEDFARLSRLLVDSGLDDAALADAWLNEVGPVCGPNLLEVAGEWAGFDRDWLVAEITRARGLAGRALQALTRGGLRLAHLPDWLELQAWIALRRAPAAVLESELKALEAARRRRAVVVAAERETHDVAPLLADPDAGVRRLALKGARSLTAERLAPHLDDADEAVREAAADALARVATGDDLPRVLEALERGDLQVRCRLAGVPWRIVGLDAALAALGRMLGPEASSGAQAGAARACTEAWAQASREAMSVDPRHAPLRDALRAVAAAPSPETRAAAVTALGWWQGCTGEAAVDLAAFAGDADPDVRRSAAYALGHAGRADPEALAALERLLGDRPSQSAALDAVARLGPRAASLRPRVERLLHASDILVQVTARRCLDALGEV